MSFISINSSCCNYSKTIVTTCSYNIKYIEKSIENASENGLMQVCDKIPLMYETIQPNKMASATLTVSR